METPFFAAIPLGPDSQVGENMGGKPPFLSWLGPAALFWKSRVSPQLSLRIFLPAAPRSTPPGRADGWQRGPQRSPSCTPLASQLLVLAEPRRCCQALCGYATLSPACSKANKRALRADLAAGCGQPGKVICRHQRTKHSLGLDCSLLRRP